MVLLNEEGVYRLYDLQGEYHQFSLGFEASDVGIIDAKIYETGLVAMTSSLTFLEVKGWDGTRPLTLANPGMLFTYLNPQYVEISNWCTGLSQPPHSWEVIPPDMTISRHVELLVSTESTVLIIDSLDSIDQRLSRGPFTHISLSPSGKALALLTMSGILWVVSIDFQRSLAEYDTHNISADELAKQVVWCGNDAILVTWESATALIGPFGDVLRYTNIHWISMQPLTSF